jgi:hypothetical protein
VVERAKTDRRLTDRIIEGYLRDLQEEIRDLETRLQLLRGAAAQKLPIRATSPQNARRAAPVGGTRERSAAAGGRASAKNTTSRKLQGQYIGFLRQLPRKDRPKYQELARTKGREIAIAAIRKALGK